MGVPDVNKEANVQCQHVCESGCSIYKDRPKPCRDFQCAWLQGLLRDDQRPDRLGIEFHPDPGATFNRIAKGRFLVANELYPGAAQTEAAKTSFQLLAATGWLIYVRQVKPYVEGQTGREVYGPPELAIQTQGYIMKTTDTQGREIIDSIPG